MDNICFPPPHTTIAFAGNELFSCGENPVELSKAYAYDCNSILWVTNGDGHFDCDTVANPFYTPGSQDIEYGSVTLTLTAYGNDTIVSTTAIHFMRETSLGEIVGETLQGKAIVEVYNLLGEQMIAKKVSHLQKGVTHTLDLSHLVSGLYIVKLNTENGICSKKVSVR